MPQLPTPDVALALDVTDAATGDPYGTALAEVLTLAREHADALARRRDDVVEGLIVELSLRRYGQPLAHLSPRERTFLLDRFARRAA